MMADIKHLEGLKMTEEALQQVDYPLENLLSYMILLPLHLYLQGRKWSDPTDRFFSNL